MTSQIYEYSFRFNMSKLKRYSEEEKSALIDIVKKLEQVCFDLSVGSLPHDLVYPAYLSPSVLNVQEVLSILYGVGIYLHVLYMFLLHFVCYCKKSNELCWCIYFK